MSEIVMTVIGTVIQDLRTAETRAGAKVTSFRLASNSRRLNRTTGEWEDGEATFLTVNCWRSLGENVSQSVKRGDAVIVTGRLRVREWSSEERNGISVEIEASSVGHDLNRGVSSFHKVKRGVAPASGQWDEKTDHDALAALADEAGVTAALDPVVVSADGSVVEPPF